jgi:DNA processing protein
MALGVGRQLDGSAAADVDPYAAERAAWAVLASVHRLGPIGFAALLNCYGSAQDVLAAATESGGVDRLIATPAAEIGIRERPITDTVARAIADAAQGADRIVGRLRALDVRVVTVEEPSYPLRLAAIAMPPHVLYLRGPHEAMSRDRAVAVVGTRRATAAGRATAARIATALAAADATVVSGLAFGIDGAAHEATVRAGGTTVAVIGGGHAALGPAPHIRLADVIVARGGAVVSELGPDVPPSTGTFPRRNRIISGLTDATVVVEAPASSGALITASWALEQGRGCFLVPGPIDSRASAGCLAFLREFAEVTHLVAGIPQLIADLGFSGEATPDRDALASATAQDLGLTEAVIARGLLAGYATVDELVATTDLPVATVLAALTLLQRRGLTSGAHGRYRPSGSLIGEQTAFWPGASKDRPRPVARAGPAMLP